MGVTDLPETRTGVDGVVALVSVARGCADEGDTPGRSGDDGDESCCHRRMACGDVVGSCRCGEGEPPIRREAWEAISVGDRPTSAMALPTCWAMTRAASLPDGSIMACRQSWRRRMSPVQSPALVPIVAHACTHMNPPVISLCHPTLVALEMANEDGPHRWPQQPPQEALELGARRGVP